jgi:hypothetical protein
MFPKHESLNKLLGHICQHAGQSAAGDPPTEPVSDVLGERPQQNEAHREQFLRQSPSEPGWPEGAPEIDGLKDRR